MSMEPLPAIGHRIVSLTMQPLIPLNGKKREKTREGKIEQKR